jgi:two-component system invasion response regulator UvrY
VYCRGQCPNPKSLGHMSNRLLIGDDNAIVRSVIRAFVEADGYKVCGEAADGFDAIRQATELQPDAILLDLSMPRLNGAEAASVLRCAMPRVPILLFTMHADDFGKKFASAIGVNVVLSKPEGLSKLLSEHLKTLLNPTDEPPTLFTEDDFLCQNTS